MIFNPMITKNANLLSHHIGDLMSCNAVAKIIIIIENSKKKKDFL